MGYYLYDLLKENDNGVLIWWRRRRWCGFLLDVDLYYYQIMLQPKNLILYDNAQKLKWYGRIVAHLYYYKYNVNNIFLISGLEYLTKHEGIYRFALNFNNYPISRKGLIGLDYSMISFLSHRYLRYVEYSRVQSGQRRFRYGLSNNEGRGKFYTFEYGKNYFFKYLGREQKSLFQRVVIYDKMTVKRLNIFHKLIYITNKRKLYSCGLNKKSNNFFLNYYFNFFDCHVLLYTYNFLNRRRAQFQRRNFSCLHGLLEYFHYRKRTLNLMMLYQYPQIFRKKRTNYRFTSIFFTQYSERFLLSNSIIKFYNLNNNTVTHYNRKWNRIIYFNTSSHLASKSFQQIALFSYTKYTCNKLNKRKYKEQYKSSCGSLVVDALILDYGKCINSINLCIYYDILTFYNISWKQKMQKHLSFCTKNMFFYTQDMFYFYIDISLQEPVDKIIWLTKTRFSGIEWRFTLGKFGRKCVRKYHFWMDSKKKPFFPVKLRSGVPKYDFPSNFIQGVSELSYSPLWIIKYSELL